MPASPDSCYSLSLTVTIVHFYGQVSIFKVYICIIYMQFRDFAENLVGSKVKVKMLRYMFREDTITSERELAKIVGISHGATNKAVRDLYELNLITPLRVGNATAWQINKESFSFYAINKRIFSPMEELKEKINLKLNNLGAVKKVVIYGSVAEGRELPNSDIDIFILVAKEKHKKIILPQLSDLTNECIRVFGNKISPAIFTEKDCKSKRNENMMKAVSKGILVFGK